MIAIRVHYAIQRVPAQNVDHINRQRRACRIAAGRFR